MIPLRDDNPRRTTPYVNNVLIGVNVVVFLLEWLMVRGGASWVIPGYGLVPSRLSNDVAGESFTVLTSMFMHGGWEHVGFNMLFLYIFGDNVEDALGHGRYLAFYLFAGVAAAVAHVLVDPASPVPMVGASGAIGGVLGAYLVLYPRAPITVLNPILPLWFLLGLVLVFPAWLVVGEWFLWNLIRGVGSLSLPSAGGVAFWAHIGGFVAGLLAIKPALHGRSTEKPPDWQGWRPPRRRAGPGGTRRDPFHPPDRFR